MENALERRALLLHLGHTLQLLARIPASRTSATTVGELIALNPLLADEPLLEYVMPSMCLDEFVTHALQAFCTWPQQLLDETLDHDAFAGSVRTHLFDLNPGGWQAYAAEMRGALASFGHEKTKTRRGQRRRAAQEGTSEQIDTATEGIVRAEGTAQRLSESMESLSSSRVQRDNEQSLPEFE